MMRIFKINFSANNSQRCWLRNTQKLYYAIFLPTNQLAVQPMWCDRVSITEWARIEHNLLYFLTVAVKSEGQVLGQSCEQK